MRTIKFRAKSINNGVGTDGYWVESMTISKGTIKRKMNDYFFELDEGRWVGVVPKTIVEFTGLFDKTGKEIFEGDICKKDRYNELYEIVFYKNAWAIKTESNNAIWHQEFCMGARSSELTVIGNIHD